MNKIEQLLERASYRILEHNIEVLKKIQNRFKNEFLKKNFEKTEFAKYLYQDFISDKWFEAQCQSAFNQIDKIVDPNSQFNEYYSDIFSEEDYLKLTQELIFDISDLDYVSGNKINWEEKIRRSNYLSSDQFFLHAQFSYFSKKNIVDKTQRHFDFSTMPTLIRQAIELKIKNMIGLEKIETKNGKFKMVSISALINFFINNNEFLDMPVPLQVLKYINTWTNTFIHTGIVPFCWQSLEAIDLLHDLFRIENKKNNEINLFGFSYLAKGVSIEDLNTALDNNFDCKFTLNQKNIEGSLYNP